MPKKTPATIAAIRKEMRVLKHQQETLPTRHGVVAAMMAEHALKWVVNPVDWPPPSSFVVVANAGAEQARKRRR
jgi:hypothetical protein